LATLPLQRYNRLFDIPNLISKLLILKGLQRLHPLGLSSTSVRY
jgi:hypothetical protein